MIASAAIAGLTMGFAGYLERFVPIGAVGGRIGVAAITIIVLTITNYLGVKPGTVTANVFTVCKIAALGALIVIGIVVNPGVPPVVAAPPAPPLATGVAAAFVAVLFTIGGWQQTNMVAGEIRDPGRTLPKALTVGIGIVIAVYLGANIAYLRTLGRDGLAASTAVAADTAGRLIGPAGATAITVAAMLSIFGFVNVALLTNARVLYALGTAGAFLPSAGKVHQRFGSPHIRSDVVSMCRLRNRDEMVSAPFLSPRPAAAAAASSRSVTLAMADTTTIGF